MKSILLIPSFFFVIAIAATAPGAKMSEEEIERYCNTFSDEDCLSQRLCKVYESMYEVFENLLCLLI